MNRLTTAVLFFLLAASAAAQDALPRPQRNVGLCLDPSRVRSWEMLDADELLADAGRLRFHVRLSYACSELDLNHEIRFVSGAGVGRLCGHSGDAALGVHPRPRGSVCRIGQVTPIDRAQYDALRAVAARRDRGEPAPALLLETLRPR